MPIREESLALPLFPRPSEMPDSIVGFDEQHARKVVDAETYTRVSIFGIHPAAVNKIRDLITKDELGKIYYINSTRVNLGVFQPDLFPGVACIERSPHAVAGRDVAANGFLAQANENHVRVPFGDGHRADGAAGRDRRPRVPSRRTVRRSR